MILFFVVFLIVNSKGKGFDGMGPLKEKYLGLLYIDFILAKNYEFWCGLKINMGQVSMW